MAEESGYAGLTVDQLSTELERRELPKSGKKADLIARLEDDDAASAGPQSSDLGPQDEGADAGEATETAEEKPKRGRRRSAETAASAPEDAKAAPRDAAGAIAVRAQAKYVRSAPRKARLVMDHIRGKKVADARAILKHTPRAAATDIGKLLESAVANAENNFELDSGELKIARAFVDEGPTIKRFRPRAQGRATPIHKRTSHMTITLTTSGDQ
jgi:large subunit ribosomal protein L22